ncbi:MAG: 1-deoxy-D-xylulose-5-phosphate synthase [Bacilli bacterium]|nr:1-deoxy-D-xylulose-5-phosphate synthase [Bacilli bacterium]
MSKKKVIQRINLSEIKDPDFLQTLSLDELKQLASDIRLNIIESTSKNGGHLSSNLGAVDATIALCKTFDFKKDKVIFDVGHQCYTYKILTGRSLERLRQKGGVCGFQLMEESPFDHFEAGHSSTSIAVANGMAIARDLNKERYNIVAFIGDSSIANGLAFEALNDVALQKHKIIIVLNDNDMSITYPVGGLSRVFRKYGNSAFYAKSKSFFKKIFCWNPLGRGIYHCGSSFKNWFKFHALRTNIFDNWGFAYIGPVDGHNIKDMEKAFARAKKIDKSVVVHIKTVKGKGYKLSEGDEKGSWHGVSPFDKETGQATKEKKYTWSKFYSDLLLEEMKKDEKIVTIVPGTGVGSYITGIHDIFPKRTIDVGIAEEYALTMSGGLSVSGYHPVVSIYSTFLQRAYDEISHDLARINLNATLLVDRAGLVGNDGKSHQGIYDEAFLISIPNTVITMASNRGQSKSLFDESLKGHGVFAIRFSKDQCKDGFEEEVVPFGKWKEEIKGKDIAIVGVGPEVEDLKAALKDKNVTLINAIYQKPLDDEWVDKLVKYKKVIIYDAYGVINGFPRYLASTLLERGFKGELVIKAIPDTFVPHATSSEQKQEYKLTVEDVISEI